MQLLSLILVLGIASAALSAALPVPDSPIITSSGPITKGTAGKLTSDVTAYLGIPFALPPVGPRRWTAPTLLKSNKPINATKFGSDCPGTISLGNGEPADENCLYLNIWVPPPKAGDKAPKAVMIWIYGGAFIGGTAAMGLTDGSLLAKRGDVIVVSMNYRLTIFGFPGASGLEDQNLGLLDQRAAVEWARDNIASFGGDPEKMVLFGQSAGADSVDIYSHAWIKDPIVKGFISESGATTMCGLVTTASTTNWPKVATYLGCTSDSTQLDCMRSKSVEDLKKAVNTLGSGFPPTFVPMPDGKVAFDNYPERMDKGLFVKAPFIIGNNDREVWGVQQMNDQEFICPAKQIVDSRTKHGVPTWRYRFYGGGPNNAVMNPAIHAAEMAFVFGSFGHGGILGSILAGNSNSQREAVSKEFMDVWSGFARDPTNGPLKMGWPVYDPNGQTLIRLMYLNETTHSLTKSDEYDAACKNLQCSYSAAAVGVFSGLSWLLEGLKPLGSLGGRL